MSPNLRWRLTWFRVESHQNPGKSPISSYSRCLGFDDLEVIFLIFRKSTTRCPNLQLLGHARSTLCVQKRWFGIILITLYWGICSKTLQELTRLLDFVSKVTKIQEIANLDVWILATWIKEFDQIGSQTSILGSEGQLLACLSACGESLESAKGLGESQKPSHIRCNTLETRFGGRRGTFGLKIGEIHFGTKKRNAWYH